MYGQPQNPNICSYELFFYTLSSTTTPIQMVLQEDILEG